MLKHRYELYHQYDLFKATSLSQHAVKCGGAPDIPIYPIASFIVQMLTLDSDQSTEILLPTIFHPRNTRKLSRTRPG